MYICIIEGMGEGFFGFPTPIHRQEWVDSGLRRNDRVVRLSF